MKPYLWLNAGYFGLAVIAMAAISAAPGIETGFRAWAKGNFNPALMGAISAGSLLPSIILIYKNNFLYATVYAMTLPSFVIPFWGLLIGTVRSLMWGIALSPADPAFMLRFLIHIPTWLLEGEGYVLAMFAVFIMWRNFFWPGRIGINQRIQGYIHGLRQTLPLYIGVAVLLGLGAIYESIATIYIIPRLITGG